MSVKPRKARQATAAPSSAARAAEDILWMQDPRSLHAPLTQDADARGMYSAADRAIAYDLEPLQRYRPAAPLHPVHGYRTIPVGNSLKNKECRVAQPQPQPQPQGAIRLPVFRHVHAGDGNTSAGPVELTQLFAEDETFHII